MGAANLISIDPGLRGCGLAYFEEVPGTEEMRLSIAAYVANAVEKERGGFAWVGMAEALYDSWPLPPYWPLRALVIEEPQVYQGNNSDDADDLIQLAGTVGAVCQLAVGNRINIEARKIRTIKPRVWKGQVPKKTMVDRIWHRLSPKERERISFPSSGGPMHGLNHNVMDAVGIGLWACGRLKAAKAEPLFRRKGK